MSIKIVIADDHKMIRRGLAFFLAETPDMEVVGEADNGRTAMLLVKKLKPQVVLMDISMPDLNGIEATKQILAEDKNIKIIALSMHSDHELILKMLNAGASGYLLKNCVIEELLTAIHTVMDQKIYLAAGVANQIKDKTDMQKRNKDLTIDKNNNEFNQFKDTFQAAIHNLRNIMMSIRGTVDIYQYNLEHDKIDINESKILCVFIQRKLSKINHVLERLFYDLDMRRATIEPIEMDKILKIFNNLIELFEEPNVMFKVNINPILKEIKIISDEYHLVWVLEELIYNAITALEKMGGTIDINLERKKSKVAIIIKDDGPGISEEIKKTLFKRQLNRKTNGLGLGLFLSRKLIKNMGGDLKLETSLGKGTICTILLPASIPKNRS